MEEIGGIGDKWEVLKVFIEGRPNCFIEHYRAETFLLGFGHLPSQLDNNALNMLFLRLMLSNNRWKQFSQFTCFGLVIEVEDGVIYFGQECGIALVLVLLLGLKKELKAIEVFWVVDYSFVLPLFIGRHLLQHLHRVVGLNVWGWVFFYDRRLISVQRRLSGEEIEILKPEVGRHFFDV